MKKLERPPAPVRLQQNYKQWGKEYAAGGNWSWRQNIDKDIRPLLLQMTGEHCAFCDSYPLKPSRLDPEIGHFKPKYISPLLAYVWYNLFPICRECNNCQGNKFYKIVEGRKIKPLKPDQRSYDFPAYFFFDPRSGEIEPNPMAEPAVKVRAEHTIELFGLNDEKRPNLRKTAIRRFLALSGSNDEALDPSDLLPENHTFGFFIQMVMEA
ncbi:MAG: hypothetical protein EPO28_15955 [Saprospiraceae bacterium]|nr:MAG: hypothetical protein EPO28_15955 [Saprospiraceae bacterium]